jgi:ribose 5-phosphate isomerase RpiB
MNWDSKKPNFRLEEIKSAGMEKEEDDGDVLALPAAEIEAISAKLKLTNQVTKEPEGGGWRQRLGET